MRHVVLIAALLLTGCATTDRIVYRDVRVPVVAKCPVDPGPEPEYADNPSAVQSTSDIYDLAKLLLAGRGQREARITELRAAVEGCR